MVYTEAKDFIKQFTKAEILEVLFSVMEFKHISRKLCYYLYCFKTDTLLAKMDKISSRKPKTSMEMAKDISEFQKADEQLKKLREQYNSVESEVRK